ncbi:hypothetical protein ABNB59_14010 [Paenibacillus larvae]|uniref:NADPH--hemoprotein reductase n=1 Tax=Paenibacillus larvae TaxID=1464 RepID=A0AAP5JXU3_9BACL|nr:hypothetical protein [Paenibacillus larvae]AQR76834.1 hypothetical protein BXP28_05050 [Paenibacillus larvae subsp. larvae]AVF22265.1 Cytochrome P450(BM-3) [Paenibacillus larvae subsp. larvae]ETK26888.1 hypothetical protein ERIC1_1c03240 [Paenibacillus larvae subsp. larvae DSM 25719]MCY7477382.1 hypothetical protein [Paenibacillus larvae]MCY7491511.1 hypothetical protein [Paenibacillus larvae]
MLRGFRGNTPKVYVQHKIPEDKEKLIQLLDEDARLYICGDGSRMAPDVEAAISKAYPEVHQVSEEEGIKWNNSHSSITLQQSQEPRK